MTIISKLAEIDPVFREVVDALYPDMDPREMWDVSKGMPDPADVHVLGGGKAKLKPIPKSKNKQAIVTKSEKGNRTQARIGLASNAVGIAAGTAGLGAALKDDRLMGAGKKAAKKLGVPKGTGSNSATRGLYRVGTGIESAAKKTRVGEKYYKAVAKPKVAAGLAAGAVGLQGLNLAGDAVANRVLARSAKKGAVSKADYQGALEDIIAARRAGQISTETAIEMADELSKMLIPPVAAVKQVSDKKKSEAKLMRAVKTKIGPDIRAVKSKGRIGLGIGAGVAAAGTGVAVAAHKNKMRPAAPIAQGPVTKSEPVDYGFTGEISKMDEDKRQVFGWCSLSTVNGEPVVDLQNDYIPIEEIEKSAYAYVIESRKGGDMHRRVTKFEQDEPLHTSDMIESFVVTPEKLKQMGFDDAAIAKSHVGWWVGFKVNDDEQWNLVKNKERTGFSVHGKGSRVSKEMS